MKLRAAIAVSEELARSFDLEANNLSFPASDRARFSAALLDQSHEHHKALRVLLSNGLIGSAFSLARALFETTIRGAWLFRCATDDDVAHFATDPKDLHIGPMIERVEALYGTTGGILTRINKQYWAGLCSYAHGGYLQAVRRLTAEHIVPAYSEEEQLKVISFADFCFFLAAIEILNLANQPERAEEWSKKYPATVPAA